MCRAANAGATNLSDIARFGNFRGSVAALKKSLARHGLKTVRVLVPYTSRNTSSFPQFDYRDMEEIQHHLVDLGESENIVAKWAATRWEWCKTDNIFRKALLRSGWCTQWGIVPLTQGETDNE